jgi:hypothetical protein
VSILPAITARTVSSLVNAEHAVLADQVGVSGHGCALCAQSTNPSAPAVLIRGAGVLVDCRDAGDHSVAQIAQDGSITVRGSPVVGNTYAPIIRQAYISDGSGATLPDTSGSWAALSGFSLALPAAIGDYVEIGAHSQRSQVATAFLDLAVSTSGSLVRYMTTGTSSPPFEGDSGGWYITSLPTQSAPRGFIVTSGDVVGGNVTFVVAVNAQGSGKIDASSNYPFYWRAVNWGVPA